MEAEQGGCPFTIRNIRPCLKKKMQFRKCFAFIHSAITIQDLSLKPFKHSICKVHYNAFRAVVFNLGCACESSEKLFKNVKAGPHSQRF